MITSEWQKIDPVTGLCFPWLTHPGLDEIATWDLADKNVCEFGAGMSTLWWARKCNKVFSVEANFQWYCEILKQKPDNVQLEYRSVHEGDQTQIEFYTAVPEDFIPDIVVVDGVLRNECLQKGIELLSEKGGIIIADNLDQDYVWVSEAAMKLMSPYEAKYYIQPDHKDHSGKPWQTVIFTIPKS